MAFHYDTLNRLANGAATLGQDDNRFPNYCRNYDSFGNRLGQTTAAASGSASGQFAATAGGANACAVNGQAGPSFVASYNANNRMASTTQNPSQGSSYDAAGDITYDGLNSYLYDGEGRICAVRQQVAGLTVMTGYIYNADGARVAKGSLTQFTCDTNPADTSTYNGFTPTSAYVLGPGGEQLTELTNTAGSGQSPAWQWLHTNVEAGALSATYDGDLSGQTAGKLYFHLTDWLGTRRQQTDYLGNPLLNFTGLPYGDGLASIPVSTTDTADATEHHFTGKERDAESGLDYFGARYYASAMGRWMSPDPSGLSYSDPFDPQSLNFYAYVGNHAIQYVDPYGLNWFNQAPCSGTYYAHTSFWIGVKSFFANLFANCGESSGGGSDPDPDPFPDSRRTITKRPFRQPLSQMDVAERLYDVKQNLSKPCKRAYSGVGKRLGIPFSMSSFARSLENGELDQHPNEEPQDSRAYATTDSTGARNIHTWANFYGESSNTQGFILWHELTHKNFRIGDDENNASGPGLDFNNQFSPYGYKGDYGYGGTGAFTDWLEGGCPVQ